MLCYYIKFDYVFFTRVFTVKRRDVLNEGLQRYFQNNPQLDSCFAG